MTTLTTMQPQLPDTPQELVKFVLVGREKLTAVRAEIRAISKVQLAREVRDQKMEEARMLSEALLDAEVKLGEMTKNIPKASGGDRRSEDFKRSPGVPFENATPFDEVPASSDFKNDTAVAFENSNPFGDRKNSVEPLPTGEQRFLKTKQDTISELGLTKKQVKQFEKLANNKDLVELAKIQARENDDIPTRSQILSMAQARERQYQKDMRRIDTDYETAQQFRQAIHAILQLPDDAETLRSLTRGLDLMLQPILEDMQAAGAKLLRIQANLQKEVKP